jgi:hypothetical protein
MQPQILFQPRRRSLRRTLTLGLAALFALLVSVPAARASAPAGCRQDATGLVTCSYAYTGSEQTLNLPAGVSTVHVSAVAGAGGGGYGSSPATPGRGATVTADVPVTGGQPLYIEVGGTGGTAIKSDAGAGGWNGGGTGGNQNDTASIGGAGGGGGGATDVRAVSCGSSCPGDATSLASRLLVAAGGGGSAHTGAGGDAGAAGGDGTTSFGNPPGGGGAGTATAAGSGGAAGCYNPTLIGSGADGALGQGGAGSGVSGFGQDFGGGGGGGGYYGGGGGAGADVNPVCTAAGGGGGSSFTVTGAANVATGFAALGTAPTVTITWQAPASENVTYYVAPSGTASSCAANSQSNPFGTIQAAIACASDQDTIVLAGTGTGRYDGIGTVSSDLTIEAAPGENARSVYIDVSKPDDVTGMLTVTSSATVVLRGVTLDCSDHACQGSDAVNNGDLTLDQDTVTGSSEGGVENFSLSGAPAPAHLTVTSSTISGNTDSAFFGTSSAGGISSSQTGPLTPQLTVVNSTVADNSGPGGPQTAGGIEVRGGGLHLVNSTIADNTDSGGAGGLGEESVGALTGLADNTLIAGNTSTGSSPDCAGVLDDGSGGHNLVGDYTGCSGMTDNVNGDLIGTPNPGLTTLGYHGGPTDTLELQQQSLALGAGDPATCAGPLVRDVDQRGDSRAATVAGSCDIGAVDGTGVVGQQWYVDVGGGATTCASNSSTNPFPTIQQAVACASSGDDILVGASGNTPYPGIGAVPTNVTIEADVGDARSVAVDLSKPDDVSGLFSVAPIASVVVHGITLTCSDHNCQGNTVLNHGALTLDDDAVTGAGLASAVANVSTTATPARLTLNGSTVANNTSTDLYGNSSAAGITSVRTSVGFGAPTARIINSTIADNTDTSGAGAIYAASGSLAAGSLELVNSMITGNTGSVGGVEAFDPETAENTIIAGNSSSGGGFPDCLALIQDAPGAHNLIGNYSGCSGMTAGQNGDQIGVANPGLGALGNHAGPTDTVPLQPGSPAIGAGDPATCEGPLVQDRDQRNLVRQTASRGACDIGAYDTGGDIGDTTPPTVTITTPANNGTYLQGTFVQPQFTCQDNPGGSGVRLCAAGPVDTSALGTHQFTAEAIDRAGNETVVTVTYTVVASVPDTTPPTVTVTTPGKDSTYTVGQVVAANYSCQDNQGGSGIKSCVGRVPSGHPLNTSAVGRYDFIVVGTDNAGNKTTVRAGYRVVAGSALQSSVTSSATSVLAKALARRTARYAVTLRNAGRRTARRVVLSLRVAAGLRVLAVDRGRFTACHRTGQTVRCQLRTLPPGTRARIVLTVATARERRPAAAIRARASAGGWD